MASAIKIRGISRRYASGSGVGPLDLDLPAASTTVLLGASGCGKSTLLRTLIGLERPDSGQAWIGDLSVCQDQLGEIRHRVGYVIQEGGLFPHLSAKDNATLAALDHGMDPDQVQTRLDWLRELVRLDQAQLDQYPGELSGGQRQRVALLRALMLEPEVLLLDEPLAALDPLLRHRLRRQLKELIQRLGKTVVLVTHDLLEAAYLADQVVLLRDGQVEQCGSPEDLLQRPASDYVRQFVNAQSLELDDDEVTS